MSLWHNFNGGELLRKFLQMWQEADPDIPEIIKAKQHLIDWKEACKG